MPNRMGSGVYTVNVTTNRNKHTKHSVRHGDSITVSTSPHYPSEIEEGEAQTKKDPLRVQSKGVQANGIRSDTRL